MTRFVEECCVSLGTDFLHIGRGAPRRFTRSSTVLIECSRGHYRRKGAADKLEQYISNAINNTYFTAHLAKQGGTEGVCGSFHPASPQVTAYIHMITTPTTTPSMLITPIISYQYTQCDCWVEVSATNVSERKDDSHQNSPCIHGHTCVCFSGSRHSSSRPSAVYQLLKERVPPLDRHSDRW